MSAQVTQQQYRIVFRGQVLPGRRIEEVRARATRRLQLPVEQLDVLFSGRKVFLKRRLDAESTKSYVRELLNVGMHVRIEREDGTLASPIAKSTPAARAALSDFDPTRTELYTATQLDGVLAAYAPGADAHDEPPPPAEAVRPPPSAARPPIKPVEPTTRVVDPTVVVPEENIVPRQPDTPPPPSLADQYAKQERKRAKRLDKMKAENARTEPLLIAAVAAALVLVWLLVG